MGDPTKLYKHKLSIYFIIKNILKGIQMENKYQASLCISQLIWHGHKQINYILS